MIKNAADINYHTNLCCQFSLTRNYFNFVSLKKVGTQHSGDCQQQEREHTREGNRGEQKTEESLIRLGRVTTPPVPRWRPAEITSGA